MTDNQDLLAMTHLGEDPSKYMKSVTPPIFMNSLHVFDSVRITSLWTFSKMSITTEGRLIQP